MALAGIQAELLRLQQLTNEIPAMKMDLELLRSEIEALQRQESLERWLHGIGAWSFVGGAHEGAFEDAVRLSG